MKITTYTAFFLLLFSACDNSGAWDCMKTSGKTTTKTRTVGTYQKIHLYGKIHLHLIQNKEKAGHIEIQAPENLIPKIETSVENSVLIIDDLNYCNWVRSYDYEIKLIAYSDSLNQIYHYGNGQITNSDTLFARELYIESDGSAGHIDLCIYAYTSYVYMHAGYTDATISGFSGVSYLSSGSQGSIDALHLRTGYTYLLNKGVSDIYLWAEKELKAQIDYLGDVYFKGSPYRIHKSGKGEGQLIKL